MKKMIAVAVGAMLAAVAFGADPSGNDYLNIAWPAQYTNGTAYSTGSNTNAFDLTAYNGKGKLIVYVSGDMASVSSTNADKIVLQHAAYATGTWSTVSALTSSMPGLAATGTITAINVDLETLKNFVRVGVTSLSGPGSNAIHEVSAVLAITHKND